MHFLWAVSLLYRNLTSSTLLETWYGLFVYLLHTCWLMNLSKEIASKLISSSILADEQGNPLNPLDANFRSLGLSSMNPIKNDSQEFKALESYARDTHGATHHYRVTITNAYRVERSAVTYIFSVTKFIIFFFSELAKQKLGTIMGMGNSTMANVSYYGMVQERQISRVWISRESEIHPKYWISS